MCTDSLDIGSGFCLTPSTTARQIKTDRPALPLHMHTNRTRWCLILGYLLDTSCSSIWLLVGCGGRGSMYLPEVVVSL